MNEVDYKNFLHSMGKEVADGQSGDTKIFFDSLLPLLKLPLCYDLIYASTRCWDEKKHVFNFNGEEMVPMVEEIEGLLCFKKADKPLVITTKCSSLTGYLRQVLGLSHYDGMTFHHGYSILINCVLEPFRAKGTNLELAISYGSARVKACMIALMGLLLFKEDLGLCDENVAGYVPQVTNGCRLGPIILGELVLSLDQQKEKPFSFMKGSPLVLHLWLMEKFKLVNPLRALTYHPKIILSRGCSNLYREVRDNNRWSLALSGEKEWVTPHLVIKEIVYSTANKRGVVLPSVKKITFYYPWRCLRQIGQRQTFIRDLPTDDCTTHWIDDKSLLQLLIAWERTKKIPFLPVLRYPIVDACYEKWRRGDVGMYKRPKTEVESSSRVIKKIKKEE